MVRFSRTTRSTHVTLYSSVVSMPTRHVDVESSPVTRWAKVDIEQ